MTVHTEGKANLVPTYLKASSAEGIRQAMLVNNLRLNAYIIYQDIQLASDGYWYCWYYEDMDLWALIKPKKAKKK